MASPPPPCSLWPSVLTATRFPRSLPLITNAYHNLCSPSENTWWIWFGRTGGYQSLPHGTCKTIGDFGRVGRPLPTLTIHYHRSDLSISAGLWPLPSPPPPLWIELNTHIMRHRFTKTLALATVMILACTLLHYLIGSMSY